jgi:glycosyltransferase involved in cell wall biosynthesis
MTSGSAPRDADAPGGRLRLNYLIGSYPVLTETFIDREVRAMQRAGVDLRIISIRRPSGSLSADQRDIQRQVIYLYPPRIGRLALAVASATIRHPATVFGTFAWLLSRPHRGISRLKTAAHFATGLYAAWILRDRRGVHTHAHFVDRAATVALVASRLLGSRYSVTAHAADLYARPAMVRERVAEARFAVTCTEYNRTYLTSEIRIDPAAVVRIYHGLDLAAYDARRDPENPPLLLSVGQLKEKKGHPDLLQACADLRDRGREVHCVIVGEGPMREELEEQIARLGLADRVRLVGAIPHSEVVEYLRRTEAFVLPCVVASDGDRDGIPNAILEAMAMGVPVISTPVSGIPEVITADRGMLVAPHDPAGLATAIEELLADPAGAAALGQAGRRFVTDEFDINRNARRLLDLFQSTAA